MLPLAGKELKKKKGQWPLKNHDMPAFANILDQAHLASEEPRYACLCKHFRSRSSGF